MSRTREPSVTYFDPNGDTRLLLKQANGSPDKKIFVVSYKTMCLVCDSWDRILNPTGYSRETRHGHTISLPHDDWKALEIILNIAHLQFDLVPRKIDFHLLLEVAVLTEKYGATKIVRPWYRKWIKHNKRLGTEPGHEEWLWIAWAFGEDQKFEKLAMKLVLELEKLPDGRFARTSEVVLDPNDPQCHFPPGILENILETREWIINYLLREVDNELCKYSDAISEGETVCQRGGHFAKACDAMVYGSLLSELRRIGIRPGNLTSIEMSLSVNEVANRLRSIKVIVPAGQYQMVGDSHDHANCSFWESNIQATCNNILSTYPGTTVGNSHRDHMAKRKAELLGRSADQNETQHGQKRKRSTVFEDPVKAESSTAASDFQDQDNEEEEDGSEESGRRILYTIKGEEDLDGEDHELTEEYDEEG